MLRMKIDLEDKLSTAMPIHWKEADKRYDREIERMAYLREKYAARRWARRCA